MAPVRPSARWRWVAFGYARGEWNRLFESISAGGFPTEDLAREALSVFGPYWIREGTFERYEIRKLIMFHPRSMRPQHVSELVVL